MLKFQRWLNHKKATPTAVWKKNKQSRALCYAVVPVIGNKLCSVNISLNSPLIAVNDEELKKRIAEELALERARRDSEAQKRRLVH